MEINGYIPMRIDREEAWKSLFSAEAWKNAIQAEKFEQVGDALYDVAVMVDFAILKGLHDAQLMFNDIIHNYSSNFNVENKLVKTVEGTFELKHPDEVEPEEGTESHPEGTRTILNYRLNMDAGNPLFNAAFEGFKHKIQEAFEEILARLETALHH
jgi:carbon monoxide dehydrogenase subunit G